MTVNFYANGINQFSFKSSAGNGFDLTYDESDYYFAKLNNVPYEQKSELLRFGIGPAYQLHMSKLSYNFGLGFYIKAKLAPTTTYFKFGIQYQVTPGLFTNIMLRTNFGRADYLGLGIGYKIPWYYNKRTL